MIKKSLFFLLITLWLFCNGFYPAAKESFAQEYGNKYANLVELERIVSSISSEIPFKVPPFFGISDNEVKSFLKSIINNDESILELIIKKWELFKQHQNPHDQTFSNFIISFVEDEKMIDEYFKTALTQLNTTDDRSKIAMEMIRALINKQKIDATMKDSILELVCTNQNCKLIQDLIQIISALDFKN